VAFLADVGQEEDFVEVEKKAMALGAKKMIIQNLQKQFVEEIVHSAIQCNAIYEDRYLLGTSLARPIIARAQVKAAEENNCQYLSHGCTVRLDAIPSFGSLANHVDADRARGKHGLNSPLLASPADLIQQRPGPLRAGLCRLQPLPQGHRPLAHARVHLQVPVRSRILPIQLGRFS